MTAHAEVSSKAKADKGIGTGMGVPRRMFPVTPRLLPDDIVLPKWERVAM